MVLLVLFLLVLFLAGGDGGDDSTIGWWPGWVVLNLIFLIDVLLGSLWVVGVAVVVVVVLVLHSSSYPLYAFL